MENVRLNSISAFANFITNAFFILGNIHTSVKESFDYAY